MQSLVLNYEKSRPSSARTPIMFGEVVTFLHRHIRLTLLAAPVLVVAALVTAEVSRLIS